jgi:hypothetical protein
MDDDILGTPPSSAPASFAKVGKLSRAKSIFQSFRKKKSKAGGGDANETKEGARAKFANAAIDHADMGKLDVYAAKTNTVQSSLTLGEAKTKRVKTRTRGKKMANFFGEKELRHGALQADNLFLIKSIAEVKQRLRETLALFFQYRTHAGTMKPRQRQDEFTGDDCRRFHE